MRTRFVHAALFAFVGGSLAALPLGAQARSAKRGSDTTGMMDMRGMMGMMSMMNNCPMMAAMTQGPGAMLARRKSLGLTDQQVHELEALRARENEALRPSMDSVRALHGQLAMVADAEQFDESGARAMFDRMGALHTDMGVAILRARHDARAVLTPEQRQKFATSPTGMGGMMGMSGMMGGASGAGGTSEKMPNAGCPMMQNMMAKKPQSRQ